MASAGESAAAREKRKGKRPAGSGERTDTPADALPFASLVARLSRDRLEALLLQLHEEGAVPDLGARVAALLAPEQARGTRAGVVAG